MGKEMRKQLLLVSVVGVAGGRWGLGGRVCWCSIVLYSAYVRQLCVG